jgi:hypothetical protein
MRPPVSKSFVFLTTLFVGAAIQSEATVTGGVDFPQGAVSFLDVGASSTLPDNVSGANCMTQADCAFVSLQDRGSNIVLRFIEDKLTGSGDDSLDLWIFEIGPDAEDSFIEISTDGTIWNPVGKVSGRTSGIDIDSFGFGPADQFAYVRMTDDRNDGQHNGATVRADIGAMGAISNLFTAVPEPANLGLCAAGLLATGVRLARRRR